MGGVPRVGNVPAPGDFPSPGTETSAPRAVPAACLRLHIPHPSRPNPVATAPGSGRWSGRSSDRHVSPLSQSDARRRDPTVSFGQRQGVGGRDFLRSTVETRKKLDRPPGCFRVLRSGSRSFTLGGCRSFTLGGCRGEPTVTRCKPPGCWVHGSKISNDLCLKDVSEGTRLFPLKGVFGCFDQQINDDLCPRGRRKETRRPHRLFCLLVSDS